MKWRQRLWTDITKPDDALDGAFWHAEDGPLVAQAWPQHNGQWRLWLLKRNEWASIEDYATLAAAKEAAAAEEAGN